MGHVYVVRMYGIHVVYVCVVCVITFGMQCMYYVCMYGMHLRALYMYECYVCAYVCNVCTYVCMYVCMFGVKLMHAMVGVCCRFCMSAMLQYVLCVLVHVLYVCSVWMCAMYVCAV